MMNQGRIRARAIGRRRRAACPGIWRRGSCQGRDIPCGLPVLLCWSCASAVPWFPQPAGLTRHILLVPSVAWPANHSYLDTLGLKHLAFKIPTPTHTAPCAPGVFPLWPLLSILCLCSPHPSSFLRAPWGTPLLASPCSLLLCVLKAHCSDHVISPCPFLHVHF